MGEQVGARFLWGCSSVGRAPALQAGGQEFESLHLHSVLLRSKHFEKLTLFSVTAFHAYTIKYKTAYESLLSTPFSI